MEGSLRYRSTSDVRPLLQRHVLAVGRGHPAQANLLTHAGLTVHPISTRRVSPLGDGTFTELMGSTPATGGLMPRLWHLSSPNPVY
jgi:hypothetical protein